MKLIHPAGWRDYELIDSGGLQKLERFGKVTLARPEPQAIWPAILPASEWQRLADAQFRRIASRSKPTGAEGSWERHRPFPDRWDIGYAHEGLSLRLQLSLSASGHVGVFPEQADNWGFIFRQARSWGGPGSVLNLFAYTGAASLAAKAAGCDVTHVDAIRPMLTWASQNQRLSGLDGIRWVAEDALRFAGREAKRQRQYRGIILDPPAYGRGPEGEKWVLEEGLPGLLQLCGSLLSKEKGSFLVLNLYSMGLSALVAENLCRSVFGDMQAEFGENFIPSRTGQRLPLGTFLRFAVGGG